MRETKELIKFLDKDIKDCEYLLSGNNPRKWAGDGSKRRISMLTEIKRIVSEAGCVKSELVDEILEMALVHVYGDIESGRFKMDDDVKPIIRKLLQDKQ